LYTCPSTRANSGTTIDTSKERRKNNIKAHELFNDTFREVNDAAT
jgi:hypothetical protein